MSFNIVGIRKEILYLQLPKFVPNNKYSRGSDTRRRISSRIGYTDPQNNAL